MAANLTGGPKDTPATVEEQLAAHHAAMQIELTGLERRRAGIADAKSHAAGRLDERLKHIKSEIKKAAKALGAHERAAVDEAEAEQATTA